MLRPLLAVASAALATADNVVTADDELALGTRGTLRANLWQPLSGCCSKPSRFGRDCLPTCRDATGVGSFNLSGTSPLDGDGRGSCYLSGEASASL